jgi:ferric-dicitrate binding protein FerR (iron transport regulator)
METENLYNRLFAKVLSGNALAEEKEAFEKWLMQSKRNAAQFSELKKIWGAGESLREYDLQTARLKTELKILQKQTPKKGLFHYWQKVAAFLVVPLLIFSGYYYFKYQSGGGDTMPVETIKTPLGARTSLVLSDGSTIWLNSGSEISYPHRFGTIREVILKGEMYLEVTKDKRPFIVKTGYGNVVVHGTTFNVSAYDNEPFTTTLIEGSVSVTDYSGEEKARLKPGFQFALENNTPSVKKVSAEFYTSWKEGKLIFKREPFEEVAKRLERWFNVTIKLKGETIKNLWYTGTIEMESFSEVLELIRNTTPIEYSFDSRNRVLIISSKI